MYVLKRLGLIMLLFLVVEGVISVGWLLLHGSDRRVLQDAGSQIEGLRSDLARERVWLAGRVALGDSIDTADELLGAGAGSFSSPEVYETARAAQAARVSQWNSRLEEHERRGLRADSLAAVHDSLVGAYEAAYRRAYPSWVLLPRPEPPGAGGESRE